MNKEGVKIINNVPDKIIELSENVIGALPSILETDFYTIEVLQSILKNNKLIWSDKYYNGSLTIYNEGLIEFDNKIYFYFIKKRDENTYKFFCLSKEDSTDSIIFYLNKFKKYKTIS
jgi:hypothetical protein